jgi:hypothetical protein
MFSRGACTALRAGDARMARARRKHRGEIYEAQVWNLALAG